MCTFCWTNLLYDKESGCDRVIYICVTYLVPVDYKIHLLQIMLIRSRAKIISNRSPPFHCPWKIGWMLFLHQFKFSSNSSRSHLGYLAVLFICLCIGWRILVHYLTLPATGVVPLQVSEAFSGSWCWLHRSPNYGCHVLCSNTSYYLCLIDSRMALKLNWHVIFSS